MYLSSERITDCLKHFCWYQYLPSACIYMESWRIWDKILKEPITLWYCLKRIFFSVNHNCDSLLIRLSQFSKEKIMPYILLKVFVQLLNNWTSMSKLLGSQRYQIFHFLLMCFRSKTVFSITASPQLPYKSAKMENSWSMPQEQPAIHLYMAYNNLVF